MKTMKRNVTRILVLALALSMLLLTFAACGKKETAFSLLSDAIEKMEAQGSMEMNLNMDMEMKLAGVTVEIPMTMHYVVDRLDTEAPRLLMDMTMAMMGQEIDMTVYSESDGVYYLIYNMMGIEMNMKTSDEEVVGSMGASSANTDMIRLIPEEYLADTEIVINEKGEKEISISLKPEVFGEIFSDVVESNTANATGDGSVESMEIRSANIVYRFNEEGYFTSGEMSYDMTFKVSADGVSMDTEATVAATFEYLNPGKDVTVTPPEGYLDFPDMDEIQ